LFFDLGQRCQELSRFRRGFAFDEPWRLMCPSRQMSERI
jgi:hypothetical protein